MAEALLLHREDPPAFSPRTSTFSAIARHAVSMPEKTAVVWGNSTLTYQRLAEQVSKIAASILSQGIMPGQRVAVETDSALEHLIGVIGAMAAGAIAVALPTDAASYQAIVRDAEPSIILATGPVVDDRPAADDVAYKRVADILSESKAPDLANLQREPRAADIAMLYYTSGTSSGVRKGVMQSYGQLHNTVHYITQIMGMEASICEFVASPTDNAFWFGRCRCIFHVGGTAILNSGVLNPFSIVAAINRHNGNAIGGDTAVFMLLLHHMERHLARLAPVLRWIKIASAPMPVEDKRRLMKLLPNAWIVMNYGLTEAMRTCLHPFTESPNKLDTVGQPCPSVKLRVEGADGNEAQPGQFGEILISGGNLASGYWRNPQLWNERFRDGWYHSGDLGALDKDGFLHLRGRIDHAINSGGKTIALSEVERNLRPFLRETTFVACGMDDPRGVLGEVVALCVEGEWREAQSWPELRIGLFEAMEQLLVPVAAFVVPEFPRTSNQKIQINNLRNGIEEGLYKAL